jgi:hypothetical protein
MTRQSYDLTNLVSLLRDAKRAGEFTREMQGRHWGLITGKVVDVNDPASKGRVRIAPDSFADQAATEYWCSISGSFEGIQPKALLNQKVLIASLDGSPYKYKVIGLLDGDIGLYDPSTIIGEYNAKLSATDEHSLNDRKGLSARTGVMSRLAVYNLRDGDILPPCHQKNSGAQVVVDDGYDSFCLTCLRYRGGWKWIKGERSIYSNTVEV